MAVAFRSASFATGSTPGSNSSITGTEPTGAANGDYLVMVAFMEATGSTSITVPSGWTSLKSGVAGTGFRYVICGISRGASAPSYAVTSVSSSGRYYEVHVCAFSGAGATQPDSQAAAVATGSTQTDIDPPATTAVSSAAMAVAIGIHWAGSWGTGWTTIPTGYTLRTDNTPGNDGVIVTKLLSVSGAENPGVIGQTPAADVWIAHTLTIAPPSGAQSFTLTPATETDAAQGLSFVKPIKVTLTPATEAEAAQALSVTKPLRVTLTPVAEADTAQTLTVTKPIVVTLTPAAETDGLVPLSITHPIHVDLVPADETDAAQTLSITHTGTQTLVPAAETDTPQALRTGMRRPTPTADETDAAQPLTVLHAPALVPAAEIDAAVVITFTQPHRFTLTPATETDDAPGITYQLSAAHFYTLSPAVETDIVLLLNFSIVGGGGGRRPRYYIQRTSRFQARKRAG